MKERASSKRAERDAIRELQTRFKIGIFEPQTLRSTKFCSFEKFESVWTDKWLFKVVSHSQGFSVRQDGYGRLKIRVSMWVHAVMMSSGTQMWTRLYGWPIRTRQSCHTIHGKAVRPIVHRMQTQNKDWMYTRSWPRLLHRPPVSGGHSRSATSVTPPAGCRTTEVTETRRIPVMNLLLVRSPWKIDAAVRCVWRPAPEASSSHPSSPTRHVKDTLTDCDQPTNADWRLVIDELKTALGFPPSFTGDLRRLLATAFDAAVGMAPI